MVEHLQFRVLLGLALVFGLARAIVNGDVYGTLPELVLRHLNGSHVDFEEWTGRMSQALQPEQQQLVAWNMPWTDALAVGKSLLELQQLLEPSNPLKLQLWMGLYWHLRRSRRLDSRMRSSFARTLWRLQTQQAAPWNPQLQNMWQSLPRSLRLILHSRWLCLQHERELLYALGGHRLELGANSNCSMWQVQEQPQDRDPNWLRLVNVCDNRSRWFVSMLQLQESTRHVLHTVPSHMASKLCVLNGLSYLADASADSNCHWQLNDCSHLPQILLGRK
ncbi:uncharacterized protein LOC117591835 [Drosophila guanche]|uniref:uncharacterized protein LOC117591835 n=1 Tax=Drosophila guanche TaxID=7266 RepID=UPI0014722F6B|nr:uncharacterized protein LOC117591835 [Drosophila guanche]